MSDAGDATEEREEHERQEDEPEERIQRRLLAERQFPSATGMSEYPTLEQLKQGQYEPFGWWESRIASRPWKDRPELKRKSSVPPEQSERWSKTKKTVSYALKSTLGYGLDAAHDALEISADVFRFVPIPGLEEAARVLLTIWDALQLVETNRMACLRLTERCADILISVREEIHDAGDQVGSELRFPLQRLVDSFKSVHVLLQKQVHRPFLKRYLKRDDILRSINGCDAALTDALGLFSISVQIRTLRQLQAAETQRREDTERLIASITPLPSQASQLDLTPKQRPIGLPETPSVAIPQEPLPAYTITDSSGTESSRTDSKATSSNRRTIDTEVVKSPLPTPDSENIPHTSSQVTLHPPPTPEEITFQLSAIVEQQNTRDHALDLADLRALMQEALATSSDTEMLKVLQVTREDLPEALKTLQRALEKERELEREEAERKAGRGMQPEEADEESEVQTVEVPTENKGGALRLTGLTRRLTLDSVVTKSSRKSKTLKKGSRWSTKSQNDTLDREFIETGIDALRRLSSGQELNLPNWTITRYEVDMETKIGFGFFSDVYRARWQNRVVAVKVLTQTTSRRIFIHEMTLWQKLDHPNVLPLLGASSAVGDPPWFLVSPFMNNGNLVDYLRVPKNGVKIDGALERRMVYEVAKGMAYLHRQGVMHGDLKGTNILLDDHEHCVISDFGQSEMKNEAFRLSGNHPNRGTLRWQAPEIMGGDTGGQLTYQVDVYAFAVVCVEIFSHGQLPWGMVDDETYRRLILDENKRPPITSNSVPQGLLALINSCWDKDPSVRPTFQKVVRELKKLGVSKYANSPSQGAKSRLLENGSHRKQSPDLKPTGLPDFNDGHVPERSYSAQSSPGPSTHRHTLAPGAIPMQRIITPICEEKLGDSKNTSPVDYKPIQFPDTSDSSTSSPESLKVREQRVRSKSESAKPDDHSQSTSTSRTGSSDVYAEPVDGPGFEELVRFESPPPADEIIAQRKNESRYRLTLQHTFHPSLRLALWDPSPVEIGAVGYLSRPSGKFVTLFNCFNPPESSEGRANGMSNIYGYGRLTKGKQVKDSRNITQRGLDIIQGLLWFRSRSSGDYQQNVSRRKSFPIRARQKSAFLYVEQTTYSYMDNLDTPKRWFEANIERILQLYEVEHRLQKEDVLLVIGKLDAPDYGLFVNHNNPDGQVHFNVFSSAKNGQQWGAFSVDLDSLPLSQMEGPIYHEDVPGKHASANKVSEVDSSSPWSTVLLARLRFRPDEDNPTAS